MSKLKEFFIDSVELPGPDYTRASDKHFMFYSMISFGLFILLRDVDALLATPYDNAHTGPRRGWG